MAKKILAPVWSRKAGDGGSRRVIRKLIEVFRDLGMRGVDILTVGIERAPLERSSAIARFYEPKSLFI